jgi:hypothetical protein
VYTRAAHRRANSISAPPSFAASSVGAGAATAVSALSAVAEHEHDDAHPPPAPAAPSSSSLHPPAAAPLTDDEFAMHTKNHLLAHLLPYTRAPVQVVPVYDSVYLRSRIGEGDATTPRVRF